MPQISLLRGHRRNKAADIVDVDPPPHISDGHFGPKFATRLFSAIKKRSLPELFVPGESTLTMQNPHLSQAWCGARTGREGVCSAWIALKSELATARAWEARRGGSQLTGSADAWAEMLSNLFGWSADTVASERVILFAIAMAALRIPAGVVMFGGSPRPIVKSTALVELSAPPRSRVVLDHLRASATGYAWQKITQKELTLKLGLNPGTINRELQAAAKNGELELRTSPLGTEVRLRA
jgi:hypothetical protein